MVFRVRPSGHLAELATLPINGRLEVKNTEAGALIVGSGGG
jgi:hypothetical protein